MAIETKRIIKEHLIICEGRDAFEFLIAFLNSPTLQYDKRFSNDIQVFDFGGNEQLEKYLTILKLQENFKNVKSLMIIRDAERNAKLAEQQIQNALRKAGYAAPIQTAHWQEGTPNTGYLLFPTCCEQLKDGTLENLCLSILNEENSQVILGEIDTFFNTLENSHNRVFPHRFKSRLHTYFSVTDKFVSFKIGEAAKAGAFDWEHEQLGTLRQFIEGMFHIQLPKED